MSECLKKSEEDYSDAKKALQEAAENTTPKHADVVEELSKAGTVAGGAWGWVIAELLGSLGGVVTHKFYKVSSARCCWWCKVLDLWVLLWVTGLGAVLGIEWGRSRGCRTG